jgi:ankyrin repeat protein
MDSDKLILHRAVEAEDLEKVRSLLEAGSDPNACDERGLTPLHVAARLETAAITAILLEGGADIYAREKYDMAPLVTAAWYGRVEVARLLLERGAADNRIDLQRAVRFATTDNGDAVIPVLQEFGAQIGLTEAMYMGNIDAFRRLLAEETDIDRLDDGYTLLTHAIAAVLGRPYHPFVKLLLERGAAPNVPSRDGWTPLMTASRWGYTPLVDQLLEYGADPQMQGPDGQTALSLAEDDPEHNAVVIERLRQRETVL